MTPTAILTYHSQNVAGGSHADNDHIALAEDLEWLQANDFRIVSLDRLVGAFLGEANNELPERAVVLTFDDGCDFEVRDLDYPVHGRQRSFAGIMRDFRDQHGANAQPGLHATSFVIASREARRVIDAGSLFAQGWISDDWWREVEAEGLIAIGNHSWDHNHPDLGGDDRGHFHLIDTHEQCLLQVVRAGAAIESHTGRWPLYFAYPYGESSAYIRETFLPVHPQVHGCKAALGTEAGMVTSASDRWNLPRFVCGRDWTSTEGLQRLLSD